jgi:hypothetical protein
MTDTVPTATKHVGLPKQYVPIRLIDVAYQDLCPRPGSAGTTRQPRGQALRICQTNTSAGCSTRWQSTPARRN